MLTVPADHPARPLLEAALASIREASSILAEDSNPTSIPASQTVDDVYNILWGIIGATSGATRDWRLILH